ncbi:MAG: glycosyltransferase family 4 protein [Nitrospinota bacterium]
MPFRILHLLTLADLGGTESSVLPLVRGMDSECFQNEIAVLRGYGPMSDRWRRAGLAVTHLNVQRGWSPRTIAKLVRLFRNGRYDVVTLYGVAVSVLGRLACKLAGQRNVVGVIRGLSNERSIRRTRLWLDKVSFSLATCYVSNSQAVIDHLKGAGFPPEKLRLAPTGLSTEPFDRAPPSKEARLQLGIGDVSPPVITCLGNLRPVKNHSLLLKACRILKDRKVEFLLLLVGAGPEESRLRSEAQELSLMDQIVFLGEREDVPTVLAASDLFVLSSLWEGLPRSIMEAMASRLAVVATDAGGVKELVVDGETGYVVPGNDAPALAGRMAGLLREEALRRRMGEAGHQRVKEHFTEERMVSAMESIYQEILGLSKSSGPHR